MPDTMQELYRIIDGLRYKLAEAEERISGLERTQGVADDDDTDDGFNTEDSFPDELDTASLDITTASRFVATGITIPDLGNSSWYAFHIGGEATSPLLHWFRGGDLPTTTAADNAALTNDNSLPFWGTEFTSPTTNTTRLFNLGLTADGELLFATNNSNIDPMPLTVYHWFDRSAPDAPDAPTLAAGNTQITATWTKPSGFVNDYNIRYRETRTTDWQTWDHDGTDLTATITGLTNGTEYEVQIQAANDSNASEWSDSGTASPVPFTQMTTTAVVFTSQQAFIDAFLDETIGTTNGQWTFDSTGSTGSSNTGPGTNNTLAYMHTETSSGTTVQAMEANGDIRFATVPTGVSRVLHLRLCIQGLFGDGTEGVQVNHRARNGDDWTEAGFIHGWGYSNNYDTGETVTDEDGNTLTFVADGGWVDFEVNIPDTATQVQIQPRYVHPSGNIYEHDIAFRQFHWVYLG